MMKMAKAREHLESAQKFYEVGMREYEKGRKSGDLVRTREGCEKIFHAYIEASVALIHKCGLPEPESHTDRRDALYKLGERRLIEIGDAALLYLHKYGYYDWKIYPEAEKSLKDVEEALRYVRRKIMK
jgi:hypothetical protein